MRAVVTGSTGFIGSRLVDGLLEEGDEVLALDDLRDTRSRKVHFLPPRLRKEGYRFEAADFLDPNSLRCLIKDAEVVFHLAGTTDLKMSDEENMRQNRASTAGTLNMLLAAKNAGVKRVVMSSSSAVYGNAVPLPVKESDPVVTSSPEAKSCLAAEEYCRLFHDGYGLQTVSLRFFDVYGPGQRPDRDIGVMTERVLKGQNPQIHGDGDRRLDLTFITDAVDAVRLCAHCPDLKGGPLNICSGRTTTMNQIAQDILEATGRTGLEPEHLPPGQAEAGHILGDNTLAKELLGWEPETSIRQGVAQLVEWYKKDRDPVGQSARP